jgi:hypothetical protein
MSALPVKLTLLVPVQTHGRLFSRCMREAHLQVRLQIRLQ